VNLRWGQFCRCSQDGTHRTWSAKVRNRINAEGFILQAKINWLKKHFGTSISRGAIEKIMKKLSICHWGSNSPKIRTTKDARTNENIALLRVDSSKLGGVQILSWSIICRLVFVSLPHHLWFGCYNDFAQYTFFRSPCILIWRANFSNR